jgi:hypothetical protein
MTEIVKADRASGVLYNNALGKGGQGPPLHPPFCRIAATPGLSAPAPRRGFGTLDPPSAPRSQ